MLIETLGANAIEAAGRLKGRDEILSQIERGELSAKEGARLPRELG